MTAETDEIHQNGHNKHHKKSKAHKQQPNGNLESDEQVIDGASEQEIPVVLSKFYWRVFNIPIVKESVEAVHGRVSKYFIGRFALDTANTTLGTVNRYTQPVQQRFSSHFDKVDDFGCMSIDMLQQRLPFMTMPTSEIVDVVMGPPLQVIGIVSTSITVPATNIARAANQHATVVVDGLEGIVDRWLPWEGEHAHADESNQAIRAYRLSLDASNRLIQSLSTQLDNHNVPRSKDDLFRLVETNVFLRTTTEKVYALNVVINEWVVTSAQAAKDRLPESVTGRVTVITTTVQRQYEQARVAMANKRLSDLSGELLRCLDDIQQYIRAHLPSLPRSLQERLEPFLQFANTEYQIIQNEAGRTDIKTIEKARNIVSRTQEQVLPVLYSSVQEVQDQLKRYSEAAAESKDRLIMDFKGRLEALGIKAK